MHDPSVAGVDPRPIVQRMVTSTVISARHVEDDDDEEPLPSTRREGRLRVHPRRRLATAAIVVALIVAAIEGTVVTSAMPTITRELGGEHLYAWVFTAFLVASTIGVLVCGKLADVFGRKPVFLAGMGLFLSGSVACGAATSIGALVAFRVVQGLGAGAIQPVAMTIGADLYTLEERARIQALFTTSWGVANVLGPILGGLLVAHASWRWVFLVNVPIGAVAVALLAASYKDPERARPEFELRGTLLAGSALSMVIFAIEPVAVSSLLLRIASIGLAIVTAWALVRQQRLSFAPILPMSLFGRSVVRASLGATLFAGALLYACAAYVPLWMSHEGGGAMRAGVALIPLLAGWAIGSTFGVRVLVRWGMRASVGGGFAIALLGAVSLGVMVASHAPIAFACASLGVLGLGLGPASSTSLVAAQNDVEWRSRGAMTSVVYATRTLGGALAVAALGAPSLDAHPVARFSGMIAFALFGLVVASFGAPTTATRSR
jgi:MFS family permease